MKDFAIASIAALAVISLTVWTTKCVLDVLYLF